MRFPAVASFDRDGNPLLSWRAHLLPCLGEKDLYQRFHLDEPWDSPHNMALVNLIPKVYDSPGRKERTLGTTTYLLPVGKQALFDGSAKGVTLRDVWDGSSNTIMIVEVNEQEAVIWTKPADLQLEASSITKACQGRFTGKLLIGMGDGTTCAIPDDMPAKTLAGMLTRAGGEPVDFDLLKPYYLRGLQ